MQISLQERVSLILVMITPRYDTDFECSNISFSENGLYGVDQSAEYHRKECH